MKSIDRSIDIGTVRLFVNGVTHTLKLARYHAKTNNQHGVEVEIHNALVELQVLREELDKPYIENGEEPPRDLLRDWKNV
jgi:hypothetical protein